MDRQGLVRDDDGVVPRVLANLDALELAAEGRGDGGSELVRRLLETRLDGGAELASPPISLTFSNSRRAFASTSAMERPGSSRYRA